MDGGLAPSWDFKAKLRLDKTLKGQQATSGGDPSPRFSIS